MVEQKFVIINQLQCLRALTEEHHGVMLNSTIVLCFVKDFFRVTEFLLGKRSSKSPQM